MTNSPAPIPTKGAMKSFEMGFVVPPEASFRSLQQFMSVLDDSTPSSVKAAPVPSEDAALQWLEHVLQLVTCLHHILRIPFFEPIEIRQLQQVDVTQNTWKAVCEISNGAYVSPRTMDGIMRGAQKLASWACRADPASPADRAHFFKLITAEIIQGVPHATPRGKSVFEILRVAHQLRIPYRMLPGGLFQIGWGCNARHLDRSATDQDSGVALLIAGNKLLSAQLLREAGLPAAVHIKTDTLPEARSAAEKIGYPVVIKPADMECGIGVCVDVGPRNLEIAFNDALKQSRNKLILVEKQVPGVCHRLFIVRGKLLYAVKRLPIGVYADGKSTIEALVQQEVQAQLMIPPWKRSGIQPLDQMAIAMLQRNGWSQGSILKRGQFIPLRRIETTAWGGVDEEVTHTLHPDNVEIATTAANLLRLEVAGIDIISRDITQPWHTNGAIINEVNYSPLLGGGEISKRYIPEYLSRILPHPPGIPVRIYMQSDRSRASAMQQLDVFRSGGLRAYFLDHAQTLDVNFTPIKLAAPTLIARVLALLMRKDVQALVILVPSHSEASAIKSIAGDDCSIDDASFSH